MQPILYMTAAIFYQCGQIANISYYLTGAASKDRVHYTISWLLRPHLSLYRCKTQSRPVRCYWASVRPKHLSWHTWKFSSRADKSSFHLCGATLLELQGNSSSNICLNVLGMFKLHSWRSAGQPGAAFTYWGDSLIIWADVDARHWWQWKLYKDTRGSLRNICVPEELLLSSVRKTNLFLSEGGFLRTLTCFYRVIKSLNYFLRVNAALLLTGCDHTARGGARLAWDGNTIINTNNESKLHTVVKKFYFCKLLLQILSVISLWYLWSGLNT